jgi:hypothetical protein
MTRPLRQDKRQPQKRKQQEPRGEKSVCHCTVLPVPTSKAVYYWSRRRFGDGQTDTKEISREKASETRKRHYIFSFSFQVGTSLQASSSKPFVPCYRCSLLPIPIPVPVPVQCLPSCAGCRFWPSPYVGYAAYQDDASGDILGDPANLELTEYLIKRRYWTPPTQRGAFDVRSSCAQVEAAVQGAESDPDDAERG